jgi:phosphonate transport system substrate-binding protein
MQSLKFSSCQAPNADSIGQAIARYVSEKLNVAAEFVADVRWQERERMLDAGEVHACWICGLPYVWKADVETPIIELLAAPVMAAARYGGRPVYFSDVVVRADSPFHSFDDLRGASWAYNEPGSHSGHNVTRYYLAARGHARGYFGRVVGSGAHQKSLRMILNGEIDASAIDSTVLETELRHRPELASQIRIIETFGPSPIPPWVVRRDLPADLRHRLRQLFAGMGNDPQGQAILSAARYSHFALVDDADYDPIREMERAARSVQW